MFEDERASTGPGSKFEVWYWRTQHGRGGERVLKFMR